MNAVLEPRIASLARHWWLFTIRGALAIAFGLIALFQPGAAMLALVLVFAAYALVDGVFAIVASVRAATAHERWGYLLFEGIVRVAAAVIAFLWPGITVLAFVILVAVWALMSGGLMLATAFRLHMDHGRFWLVLGGIVSLLYGALLIVTPLIGALVLTWWLAAYALVFGVALIVLSLKLRARHGGQTHHAVAA
jgi:uncharacterized membrane protein HdeD (DUF308 family)